MTLNSKLLKASLITFLSFFLFIDNSSAQGVTLYTPYTKIVAPPGETLEYSIDVKNTSNERKTADIYLSNLPSGWSYDLTAGSYKIKQLALLPGKEKTVKLKIDIPYKVRKGTHRISVTTNDFTLPLYVIVSKQGNYKTEFICKQTNMQGTDKSNYTFTAELKNVTGEKQRYALQSFAPRGWEVKFKPNYKQATSVEVEPNKKVNVSIEVKPPYNVKAGTYKIPVSAVNSNTSSEISLEVVITGTYNMELTTPTGLLSTDITAGDEKKVKFLVKNTGSSKLEKIKLNANSPRKWEVSFDPKEINELQPGKNAEVTATIKVFEKAIAGDYVTKVTASTPETNSNAVLRVTVKTSMLVGWIGILIILIAIGIVFYLFKKFGRR